VAKHITNRSDSVRHRRLYYDGIMLVPAGKGRWHVPGGQIASTCNLVTRANRQGVTVQLAESSPGGQMITQLN